MCRPCGILHCDFRGCIGGVWHNKRVNNLTSSARITISLDSFPVRSDRHSPFAAHSRFSISSARFQPKPFTIKRFPTKAGIHVKSLLRGPMSAPSIRAHFVGEAQKTQAVGRFDDQKRQHSR